MQSQARGHGQQFAEEALMNCSRKISGLFFLLLLPYMLCAQQAPSDPLLHAMQQELDRSLQSLKKTPVPPYFLSYQLTDNRSIHVSASFGALTGSSDQNTRLLDLDLRSEVTRSTARTRFVTPVLWPTFPSSSSGKRFRWRMIRTHSKSHSGVKPNASTAAPYNASRGKGGRATEGRS